MWYVICNYIYICVCNIYIYNIVCIKMKRPKEQTPKIVSFLEFSMSQLDILYIYILYIYYIYIIYIYIHSWRQNPFCVACVVISAVSAMSSMVSGRLYFRLLFVLSPSLRNCSIGCSPHFNASLQHMFGNHLQYSGSQKGPNIDNIMDWFGFQTKVFDV